MSSTFFVQTIRAGARRKALTVSRELAHSGFTEMPSTKEKSGVDDDEENDEEECERALSEESSSPTLHRFRDVFTSMPSVTSSTNSSRAPSQTLSLSDDVISSMTRSYENRTSGVESELPNRWAQYADFSVDPDGAIAFYWKTAVTCAIIYNSAVVILRTAFSEMRDERVFSMLDFVCDAIYLMDMGIESKTSFLSDGCMVRDSKETLQNYKRKSYFISDIISIMPIHTAVVQLAYILGIFGVANPQLALFWEYFCVYHPVLRLNRLLKSHVMESFFQRTESRTNNPNVLRAFKLSLHLGLVIHWIACLYYMLSEYEGLGSSEWAYPIEPKSSTFSRKYILCMFWSTMTLTTIGERPPPSTELEYIFTGSTFLIGVFVFAAIVGNVGDVISNMNAARRDFQARMDQIKFYMDQRCVPDHLQTRIKRWAEYTWDRTKAIDEPNVLQLLPDRLRTEVAIHVHLDILKKVSIFDECEEGLLRELVLKLKSQIFSPGDYICRIGEIGREMYIINHGKVEILYPDTETGAMKQVAVMHPGNFFGEISLLKLDDGQNKRTADVKSVGFSELLCLSRRDLMVALTEYPEAKKILEDYARQRFNNTKKITPPDTEQESGATSPHSATSSMNIKRSAKQIFAQVMKQEKFTKLLADVPKSTDLLELKAAVDELKASKTAQVEEQFMLLRRKIHGLEQIVLDKNLELQEARAQISYLETVIQRLSHIEATSANSSACTPACGSAKSTSGNLAFQWPDLHRVNTMVHDMQSQTTHAERDFVKDKYFFNNRGEDEDETSEFPTKSPKDKCRMRRDSFRNSTQKSVHSADISPSNSPMGSLSFLPKDSGNDNKHNGNDPTGKSRPQLFTASLGHRRSSAPYVFSNVGHDLRTYIRKSANRYDSNYFGISSNASVSVSRSRSLGILNNIDDGVKRNAPRNKYKAMGSCKDVNTLCHSDLRNAKGQSTATTYTDKSRVKHVALALNGDTRVGNDRKSANLRGLHARAVSSDDILLDTTDSPHKEEKYAGAKAIRGDGKRDEKVHGVQTSDKQAPKCKRSILPTHVSVDGNGDTGSEDVSLNVSFESVSSFSSNLDSSEGRDGHSDFESDTDGTQL